MNEQQSYLQQLEFAAAQSGSEKSFFLKLVISVSH